MNISNFKKGDTICRVEPAKEYASSGIRERSYIGDKMVLVGVANGLIYATNNHQILGDRMVQLPLDVWSEGWEFYIDPSTFSMTVDEIESLQCLRERLQKAIDTEDFETAEIIRKKIEALRQ